MMKRVLIFLLFLCLLLQGCAASPASGETPVPSAPDGYTLSPTLTETSPAPSEGEQLLGEGDLLLDFTMRLPENFAAEISYSSARLTDGAGAYAGSVEVKAYYPEGGHESLMDNHCEVVYPWEEISLEFTNPEPWQAHVEKVLYARFKHDDFEDHHSARSVDSTIYYILFQGDHTFINDYGDTLTYQNCYKLRFFTDYWDEQEVATQVWTEEEILACVKSFALKEEYPYQPAFNQREFWRIGAEALLQAMAKGQTPEARDMHTAFGNPKSVTSGFQNGFSMEILVEDGRRVCRCSHEKGGIHATIDFDMTSGEQTAVTFERK